MNNFIDELYFSRFILTNDLSSNECLFNIPSQWWSRIYEYKWASLFAKPEDVCLDAACGLDHHLKFYLASICNEAHACDVDKSITDKGYLANRIRMYYGTDSCNKITKPLDKLNVTVADISNLPYEDKKFDKIYCISVLGSLENDILEKSFLELNRVLKDDGLVILTFDVPTYEPTSLQTLIDKTGFSFACGVELNKPSIALQSTVYKNLSCFRAVLTKNTNGIVESANMVE